MTTYINADNGVVSGVAGLKYSADSSGVLVLQTNTTNALTLDTTQGATFATGILATNPFAGSFSDGTVVDYITGLGRISVGASDGIAFYNGGIANTELMRISSAGNVGINTTAPTTRLQIQNTGSGYAGGLAVTQGAGQIGALIYTGGSTVNIDANYLGAGSYYPLAFLTSGAEKMRLDTSGNLLIGTTSSVGKLSIAGTTTDVNIGVQATTGSSYTNYVNTSGSFYIGTDNSAGTSFGSAYGRYIYSSGAYPLITVVNGAERMRIDSAGLVGIGTTPAYKLDILAGSLPSIIIESNKTASTGKYSLITSGHYTSQTYASGFTVIGGESLVSVNNVHIGGYYGEATAATGIFFYTAANTTTTSGTERMVISSSGDVYLSNATSKIIGGTNAGRMVMANADQSVYAIAYGSAYSGTPSIFTIVTNTNKVTTINTTGNLSLAGGSATADGVGITFPATQSASTNANCLDDYEEGTWTPAFNAFSGTTGWTFYAAAYIKIGKTVFINCGITPGTGTISCTANSGLITGLPFPATGANSPVPWSTNYIETLGTGVIYGSSGIYAPTLSVANSRTIFFAASYITTA